MKKFHPSPLFNSIPSVSLHPNFFLWKLCGCSIALESKTPYYHLNFIYDFAAHAYAHVYRDASLFCKSEQISVIYGDCTFRWSGYFIANGYILLENLENVSRIWWHRKYKNSRCHYSSTTITSQLTLWADEKFMIQILAKAHCFFSVWMKRLKLHEAVYNRIEFLINKSIVQETF